MPATKQEQTSIAELRQAHESRLRFLRLRAAREGNDAAPEVLTEIEDIEARLSQLAETLQTVAQSPIQPDIADAIGPVGRHQLTMSHIMRLDAEMSDCKKALTSLVRLRPWVIISAVCGVVALILSVAVLVRVY